MNMHIVWYALGGIGVLIGLRKLSLRLQLSKAKHPSLRGHARISRLLARLVRFYEYDDARYFRADDAPEGVAERRRAGFLRLAELFKQRFARSVGATADIEHDISDVPFTASYRVPFQFRRLVRHPLKTGASLQPSSGVTLTHLDGNQFYDLTGSHGVNVFGYDFSKDYIDRGSG